MRLRTIAPSAASLLAAICALPCLALAAPVRPANGTYVYSVLQHGQQIGNSTVTVSSSPKGVDVHEKAMLGPVSADISFSLDPASLAEGDYAADVTTPAGSQRVVVTPQTGALSITAARQNVNVAALEGAPSLLVSDNFVSTLVLAPAIAAATNATSWTFVALSGGKALRAKVQPTGNPAIFSVDVDGTAFNYTVDPSTMLVREVRVPSQDVVVSLKT